MALRNLAQLDFQIRSAAPRIPETTDFAEQSHERGNMASDNRTKGDVTRREFVGTVALASGVAAALPLDAEPNSTHPGPVRCSITINNQRHDLTLDARITLLDLLREQM